MVPMIGRAYTRSYSSNDQRRDKRWRLPPLSVRIGDQDCVTHNYSLGGMLVGGYSRPPSVGTELSGRLCLAAAEDPSETAPFQATVVRRGKRADEVAVQFTRLSPDAFSLLEACMLGTYRRSLISAE
jgi:hypothetical protein